MLAFLSASAASAQLAPGVSGFSDAPIAASQAEYWDFMHELGHCLARTKRAQSAEFLTTTIGSEAEGRAFKVLVKPRGNNSCMRNMVSAMVIRAQVRGVVAEGLLKATAEPGRAAAMPAGRSAPAAVRSIHDFADCYVAADPAGARGLLEDTRPGTREEVKRVRAMAGGFGACLPQGRKIQIVPIDIRLAIAEALYRASAGPSAMTQGSN